MNVVRYGELLPPMSWWGRTFVHEMKLYLYGEIVEERVIEIRLPSWGYGYDLSLDEDRWGQRILSYRGRSGFRLRWHFT